LLPLPLLLLLLLLLLLFDNDENSFFVRSNAVTRAFVTHERFALKFVNVFVNFVFFKFEIIHAIVAEQPATTRGSNYSNTHIYKAHDDDGE